MASELTNRGAGYGADRHHTAATRLRPVLPVPAVVLPWLVARLLVVPRWSCARRPVSGSSRLVCSMDGQWFRLIALDWYDRPYIDGAGASTRSSRCSRRPAGADASSAFRRPWPSPGSRGWPRSRRWPALRLLAVRHVRERRRRGRRGSWPSRRAPSRWSSGTPTASTSPGSCGRSCWPRTAAGGRRAARRRRHGQPAERLDRGRRRGRGGASRRRRVAGARRRGRAVGGVPRRLVRVSELGDRRPLRVLGGQDAWAEMSLAPSSSTDPTHQRPGCSTSSCSSPRRAVRDAVRRQPLAWAWSWCSRCCRRSCSASRGSPATPSWPSRCRSPPPTSSPGSGAGRRRRPRVSAVA